MGITPHDWISTENQKCRGRAPGSCRTIINKQEWETLYQTMRDSRLFVPGLFRTIFKQPVPTRITTAMHLWLVLVQGTPHHLSNAKQMANKIDLYWENGPGRSLPPNPCKCYNCVDLHRNSRQTSLSLPVSNLWNHALSIRIYDYQGSGNIPRKYLLRD